MNNRDRKILIGELRLKSGIAFIIFLVVTLIITIATVIIIEFGNPSSGIINRAYLAILIVLLLIVIIFRKIFLIAIDLIRSKKVQVRYDSIYRSIDESDFINMNEFLSKLSESGNLENVDFNHSFIVELSKSKKELLYIEQFGKVIFPKQD